MYEILQHTADVRLRVTASSLEELFADALRGLMEVMGAPVGAHSVRPETEEIELDSVDLTALLVDFLNEALVRALVGRRCFTGASFASLGILRPIARAHLRMPAALRTGTAALVGAHAVVLQRVDQNGGLVRIGGEDWTARTFMPDQVLEPGTKVEVVKIEGATALVLQ